MIDKMIIRKFEPVNSRVFYTCLNCSRRTLIDLHGSRATPYRVKIPCMHCAKLIWDITVINDNQENQPVESEENGNGF